MDVYTCTHMAEPYPIFPDSSWKARAAAAAASERAKVRDPCACMCKKGNGEGRRGGVVLTWVLLLLPLLPLAPPLVCPPWLLLWSRGGGGEARSSTP